MDENRIRTGCTLLDLVVGGGQGLGFPSGRIINIVGDKSSGKTFLACEIVAKNYHTYKDRFKKNYDDGENGMTFDTQALYGFPMITDETLQSHLVEELDVNVRKFLTGVKSNELGIYVLDSLDGLSNEDIEKRADDRVKAADSDKEFKSGTYGVATPKFLSQEFFRTKTKEFAEKETLFIIISQVRENLEKFSFKKFVRSGGKALDFYAHTVLWLSHVQTIKKKDRAVGVIVNAKADKSKTPRPYRDCNFIIYFDYGVDNIGSNLDYLFDLRTDEGNLIQARAQNIYWPGKGKKVSMAGVKEFLDKQNLYEKARENKKGPPTLDGLMEWIQNNEEAKAKFDEEFGQAYSRTALIEMIEKDPKMADELEKLVIEKWEGVEAEIASNRKRKYE